MEGPQPIATPILRQTWSDVTFLHWRIDAAEIVPFLPRDVLPDEHDGSAWVGLIPFRLHDTASLRVPLPFGTFPETNVRVYARDERGQRGVVFLSLDSTSLPAVAAAHAAFRLPYVWSRMRVHVRGGIYSYVSRRHALPRGTPTSVVRVRPGAPVETDALADFLTARWALYSTRAGRTIRLPNIHEPWQLHSAELLELDDSLVARAGIYGLHDRAPDSVLFSPGVHAAFGRPVTLTRP